MHKILLLVLAVAHSIQACERHLLSREPEKHHGHEHLTPYKRQSIPFPPKWTPNEKLLHESFSTATIDAWSSYYTHGNHIAGLNKSMAEATRDQWIKNGVPAEIVEYEVLLSYPKEQSLVLKSGEEVLFTAQMHEDRLEVDETTEDPGAVQSFHGYSGNGEVEAEYVYVGRGAKEDFDTLVAAKISLEGKIALAKYGGPFRGAKVQNAEAHGMVGCVIYSDPGDDNFQVKDGHAAYPDGPARNPSSVQRGSVGYINHYPGDPTTPGKASKPGVERVDSPTNLPKIPSVPLSYRDAQHLLNALDGQGLSGADLKRDGWTGSLNATYSTGPAPGVKLSLTNIMKEKITPIWNVIGTIEGTNPNETVIIGNHRDAWIIGGAADPNSGTAILIETTKAFGQLLKTGWKPKRNTIFASWDAEEYALIGSTEWVEEHTPFLSSTALTYLNIDIAVSGPLPGAGATPELRSLAQDVMSRVIYRNQTLHDAWYALNRFRPEDNGFSNLGSGSDFVSFLQLGIGALDFGMDGDKNTPTYHYHSNYDSYHWMKTLVDPDFSIHATVGQFITLMAYRLVDDALLPLDMSDLARNVNYWVRDMVVAIMNIDIDDTWRIQTDVGLSALDDAAKGFAHVADAFVAKTKEDGFLDDEGKVQDANRRIKEVMRVWIREDGLPGREFYKNGLYTPNKDDGYKPMMLPGSMEALQERNYTQCKEWNEWLTAAIKKASQILTY